MAQLIEEQYAKYSTQFEIQFEKISEDQQDKLSFLTFAINNHGQGESQYDTEQFPSVAPEEQQALINLPVIALKKLQENMCLHFIRFCQIIKSLDFDYDQSFIEGELSFKGELLGMWKSKKIKLDMSKYLLYIPRSEPKQPFNTLDLSLYQLTWLGELKGIKNYYAFKLEAMNPNLFNFYKLLIIGSDEMKYSTQWYGYFKLAYQNIIKNREKAFGQRDQGRRNSINDLKQSQMDSFKARHSTVVSLSSSLNSEDLVKRIGEAENRERSSSETFNQNNISTISDQLLSRSPDNVPQILGKSTLLNVSTIEEAKTSESESSSDNEDEKNNQSETQEEQKFQYHNKTLNEYQNIQNQEIKQEIQQPAIKQEPKAQQQQTHPPQIEYKPVQQQQQPIKQPIVQQSPQLYQSIQIEQQKSKEQQEKVVIENTNKKQGSQQDEEEVKQSLSGQQYQLPEKEISIHQSDDNKRLNNKLPQLITSVEDLTMPQELDQFIQQNDLSIDSQIFLNGFNAVSILKNNFLYRGISQKSLWRGHLILNNLGIEHLEEVVLTLMLYHQTWNIQMNQVDIMIELPQWAIEGYQIQKSKMIYLAKLTRKFEEHPYQNIHQSVYKQLCGNSNGLKIVQTVFTQSRYKLNQQQIILSQIQVITQIEGGESVGLDSLCFLEGLGQLKKFLKLRRRMLSIQH